MSMAKITKIDEIEMKIQQLEDRKESKRQELQAIVSQAQKDLEKAKADLQEADDNADLSAYQKASGEVWLCEKKVEKAEREFAEDTDDDQEVIAVLGQELTKIEVAMYNQLNEKIDKFNAKIMQQYEATNDEYSKLLELFDKLLNLQGIVDPEERTRRYSHVTIDAINHKLREASYELTKY